MAGSTTRKRAPSQAGRWTGDIPKFVTWCGGIDDLDAYREALTALPPNAAWDSVLRCLRAGIEYHPDPPDSGSRVRAPEVFLEVDAERTELQAAKRAVLESEITRRALMAGTH